MNKKVATPKLALAQGRGWAEKRFPYFAMALYSLTPREVPLGTLSDNGTLGVTDDWVLYYEREALERWTFQQLGAVLVHEIMHSLREHGARAKAAKAKPGLWNTACDCAINDDLHEMRLPLPDGGGITPASLNKQLAAAGSRTVLTAGMVEEQIYRILERELPTATMKVACGSCSGNPLPNESDSPGKAKGGAADGAQERSPGRSEIERQLIRIQVALSIEKHANERGIGSIPSGLRTWALDQLKEAKIPWDAKLQQLILGAVSHRAGMVDHSFARISRRQAGVGFGAGRPVIPACVSRLPRVALGFDTSGSMGKEETERAAAEADAVLKAVGCEVDFLACDAKVHAIEKVSTIEQLAEHLKGGGGTSFIPIFEAVEQLQPKPELFIFMTDGCGQAPDVAPDGIDTIVVLVGKYRQIPFGTRGKPLDWFEVVEVDD